jgi:predicted PolB exonuclease-like 3'-5' exonuclease
MGNEHSLLHVWCAALVLLAAGCAAGEDARSLAQEFKMLRAHSGHFSGGAWNDDVDRYGGRKQQVMLRLAEVLGQGSHTRADVIDRLGDPDEVLKPGDMMFRHAYSGGDVRVRELLVYHWRGQHDFLYFTSDGTQVLGSGWWYALE